MPYSFYMLQVSISIQEKRLPCCYTWAVSIECTVREKKGSTPQYFVFVHLPRSHMGHLSDVDFQQGSAFEHIYMFIASPRKKGHQLGEKKQPAHNSPIFLSLAQVSFVFVHLRLRNAYTIPWFKAETKHQITSNKSSENLFLFCVCVCFVHLKWQNTYHLWLCRL